MAASASRLLDPAGLPEPLGLLVRRALTGSRDDGARIALGLEGGGLAVAMTCGMALELEELGLTRWVDTVYGTSSGSLMAAYAAGGRIADAERVLEAACTRAFIDFRRLGRAPVVSIAHLMEIVAERPPAIAVPGRPELKVLAVGVGDGVLRTLGPLRERDDALAAVRASMAIPVWSGPAVAYRGELLSDGGLMESMPAGAALAGEATHVVVLRSRPAAYRKGHRGPAYRAAERLVASRLPGALPRLIAERPARYDAEAAALAAAQRGEGPLAGRAAQLAPEPGTPLVGRLQADLDAVRGAVSAGRAVARRALVGAR